MFSIYIFRLSQHSKNLFFDLGSGTIQNMKYHDAWVFVGQKGIQGFSPYEEVCPIIGFEMAVVKFKKNIRTNMLLW